ncbi:MAG TPA: peptide chain release factor N(5)-glutamine methyltransferase [Terriglobia bacterium]|nr:peptide chain release factor N(5)-glutamine methyltransferase [Terriglobia bacterium]
MTLREALRKTAERLELHYVSNPRLNAEVIVCHCLGVEKSYLYTHDERVLSVEQYQKIEDALYQRVSGVPVQYIVGKQEFYGRYFAVNPHVLIPRPETEYIVEAVLDLHPPPATTILDIGTGSGCIGLTLALELPETRVIIADVSLAALYVARENAAALGANVSIVSMDLLDAASGSVDIIVSNPPYVSHGEASRLQVEVREHEPHVALFAPEDGLAMFRRLIPSAENVLKPGGYLIVEIGAGLEKRVMELFGSRWELLPTRNDLQGIPRTITAMLK